MMRVNFRTNLDEPQRDVGHLNAVLRGRPLPIPRKGERISFPFTRNGTQFRYDLEVCDVTYDMAAGVVEVELHLPSWQRSLTIREWSEWFAVHRHGATVLPSTGDER